MIRLMGLLSVLLTIAPLIGIAAPDCISASRSLWWRTAIIGFAFCTDGFDHPFCQQHGGLFAVGYVCNLGWRVAGLGGASEYVSRKKGTDCTIAHFTGDP